MYGHKYINGYKEKNNVVSKREKYLKEHPIRAAFKEYFTHHWFTYYDKETQRIKLK